MSLVIFVVVVSRGGVLDVIPQSGKYLFLTAGVNKIVYHNTPNNSKITTLIINAEEQNIRSTSQYKIIFCTSLRKPTHGQISLEVRIDWSYSTHTVTHSPQTHSYVRTVGPVAVGFGYTWAAKTLQG